MGHDSEGVQRSASRRADTVEDNDPCSVTGEGYIGGLTREGYLTRKRWQGFDSGFLRNALLGGCRYNDSRVTTVATVPDAFTIWFRPIDSGLQAVPGWCMISFQPSSTAQNTYDLASPMSVCASRSHLD